MKTCLIVDDSRVVRALVRQILEPMGFRCLEAEDGQIALSSCAAHMPDVVLLDWNMPVMDGITFLRQLRAMPGAAPQVVFCTTCNDLPHIQEALEAGADEYIMKPFDGDILRGKFQQIGML